MKTDVVTFERRRYGRKTYTWAFLSLGSERISLGDPWPGVTWPKHVLQAEIAMVKERRFLNNQME